MAAKPEPEKEWEGVIEGEKVLCAAGTRDVLIIVSRETLQGPDIVPRREVTLTQKDLNRLDRLDQPQKFVSWDDDAIIMIARYGMDERYTVVGVERNTPNNELTTNYVLNEIEKVMNKTKKGIAIQYFGPGKRNTGDWCFEDGFITFQHIADLYCRCFKGRVLTIQSDCSYSGSWVKNLAKFLDQNRIRPCGHSAKENKMLIKVVASCKPTEIPYRLLYSVRANNNDKNTTKLTVKIDGFEIANDQHTYGHDPTLIRCDGETFEDPCTISPLLTWERLLANDRIIVVRGKDRGRPVWHYALLDDNEEKIKEFNELTQGPNRDMNTVNISQYGQSIRSGWGEGPSNIDRDWLEKNYGIRDV